MSTLQINLPDDLRKQLEARAAESGHRDLAAYVESLLRADAGSSVERETEDLLLSRLDSGPGIECDGQFVEQFTREVAQRRAANGRRP